jgi:hypothetical protein
MSHYALQAFADRREVIWEQLGLCPGRDEADALSREYRDLRAAIVAELRSIPSPAKLGDGTLLWLVKDRDGYVRCGGDGVPMAAMGHGDQKNAVRLLYRYPDRKGA